MIVKIFDDKNDIIFEMECPGWFIMIIIFTIMVLILK